MSADFRPLKVDFANRDAYEHWARDDPQAQQRRAYENAVLDGWDLSQAQTHFLPGYCVACRRPRAFLLDAQYAEPTPRSATAQGSRAAVLRIARHAVRLARSLP